MLFVTKPPHRRPRAGKNQRLALKRQKTVAKSSAVQAADEPPEFSDSLMIAGITTLEFVSVMTPVFILVAICSNFGSATAVVTQDGFGLLEPYPWQSGGSRSSS